MVTGKNIITTHSNNINTDRITFNWNLNLGDSWAEKMAGLIAEDYSDDLINFIDQIYLSKEVVYPEKRNIFRGFRACDFDDVKVVIIDDMPARDLRSSGIGRGVTEMDSITQIPTELKMYRDSIYETIHGGYKIKLSSFDNSLIEHAEQGILFINSSMCVTRHKEYDFMFRQFIRYIIRLINKHKKNVVFLFLSNLQSDLYNEIDLTKHYIVKNPISTIGFQSEIFQKVDEIIYDKYPIDQMILW